RLASGEFQIRTIPAFSLDPWCSRESSPPNHAPMAAERERGFSPRQPVRTKQAVLRFAAPFGFLYIAWRDRGFSSLRAASRRGRSFLVEREADRHRRQQSALGE